MSAMVRSFFLWRDVFDENAFDLGTVSLTEVLPRNDYLTQILDLIGTPTEVGTTDALLVYRMLK